MPAVMYSSTELEASFRQSEILTGVFQYFFNIDENTIDWDLIGYAIVLSQDCDLTQDFAKRAAGHPGPLNGIIIYEAVTVGQSKTSGMKAREFEKICSYGMERYHFLPAIPPEQDALGAGLPDLIIDFKRYFTVSTTDLHWQVGRADGPKRRSRLTSPFLEHLQKRAADYMSRVALPEPPEPAIPFSQVALPPPSAS